jgi:hypothetical protein
MAFQEDSGPRRYLVVANQTLDSDELAEDIRARAAEGPSEFWIVVPATAVKDLASKALPTPSIPVMGGVLSVPGTREEARALAQEKLQAAVRNLSASGVTVDGEVANADPMKAVRAALGNRRFDGIIVSTLPARLSRWLRGDLPARLEREFRVPVTHVEVPKFTLRQT